MKTRLFYFPFLLLLCMLFGGLKTSPAQHKSNIRQISFATDKGTVTVNLPNDMTAGDVISGTVISEPSGRNQKRINKNEAALNNCSIETGDLRFPLSDGQMTFTIPADLATENMHFNLLDESGSLMESSVVPVMEETPFSFPENISPISLYAVPPTMEQHIPAEIIGPFDGDFSNTTLTIGGDNVDILAESPRGLYFDVPSNKTDLQKIEINENGEIINSETRLIGLDITATQLKLKPGQTTEITVDLSGLGHLQEPLPLKITNLTPEVLLLQGGNNQSVTVQPESVTDAGTFTTTLTGQSLTVGAFSILAQVDTPEPLLLLPISPVGAMPQGTPPVFEWETVNVAPGTNLSLKLWKADSENPLAKIVQTAPAYEISGLTGHSFIWPEGAAPDLKDGQSYVWTVQETAGLTSSPAVSFCWVFGPLPPADPNPGEGGDICEDEEFVEQEEKDCADLIHYEVRVKLASLELDFDNFKDEWHEHFRKLAQTMCKFDLEVSQIKHWIDTGNAIDKEAQQVQAIAGLVKNAVGKGVTAFKKGGEEAMKEMAKDMAKDKVKEAEKWAASQVAETLGALYDLEDLAIRQIGLGIAEGLTGVSPDKLADFYRRKMQRTATELESWIANWMNHGSGHPSLQDGIRDMCDFLNQLDDIESNFEELAAQFICIDCEIPDDLKEDMAKLRMDIESHIRQFGDTIDQIRQRIAQARAIVRDKNAYEDIARLGSFQNNSARKNREYTKTLNDSKTELESALSMRK